MQPAAVHEHRCKHGPVFRRRSDQACHARSEGDPAARLDALQDLSGNQPEVADRPNQRPLRPGPLYKNEGEDVGDDNGGRDDGRPFGGILILVGEHATESKGRVSGGLLGMLQRGE